MKTINRGGCSLCKKDVVFETTSKEMKGYEEWVDTPSLSIKKAMPNLPEEKRDALMNSICLDCQDKYYK